MKELVPELRFPEFKGEWFAEKIKNILDYVDYRGKTPEKVEEGILLITAKNIKLGNIDYEVSKEYIKECEYDVIMRRGKPKVGDVLITTEAPLGNVAQVDNSNIALAQRVIKYNSKDETINNTYIKHYFLSSLFQNKLLGKASGSTALGIKGKELHNLVVSFPSLPEQTKIADFLSKVDEQITLLTKKKEKLEEYKKGVMQKLFSQELRFKDENGNEYPEWEEKKLGETVICLNSSRKPINSIERAKRQGNYPYWGANNIVDYLDDFTIDDEVVLLAEDGGNFAEYKNKPIANYFIGRCWVNNHTHILKGDNMKLFTKFLFYSIVHKDINEFVTGGTRSKLTKSAMFQIKINIPSLIEQTKIANFLSAIDEQITVVEKQLAQSKTFKQGLLQKMFA